MIFPEGTSFSFASQYPVMPGGGLTAYDPEISGDRNFGTDYVFYSPEDGGVFYPQSRKVYHLVASADTMTGQECYIMLEGKAESQPAERPSAWAEEKVAYGIETGIVPQSLQSAYGNAATRAEFCALAVGLYENIKGEIAERAYFTDTQNVNVEKMAAVGVVNGVGDGKFDPSSPLTRQEAATMLCRLAEAVGKPLEKALPDFNDKASIASWAESPVGSMQASGIMEGIGNGMFAPTDPYTREQSIVTVMRLYDVIRIESKKAPDFHGALQTAKPPCDRYHRAVFILCAGAAAPGACLRKGRPGTAQSRALRCPRRTRVKARLLLF